VSCHVTPEKVLTTEAGYCIHMQSLHLDLKRCSKMALYFGRNMIRTPTPACWPGNGGQRSNTPLGHGPSFARNLESLCRGRSCLGT